MSNSSTPKRKLEIILNKKNSVDDAVKKNKSKTNNETKVFPQRLIL